MTTVSGHSVLGAFFRTRGQRRAHDYFAHYFALDVFRPLFCPRRFFNTMHLFWQLLSQLELQCLWNRCNSVWICLVRWDIVLLLVSDFLEHVGIELAPTRKFLGINMFQAPQTGDVNGGSHPHLHQLEMYIFYWFRLHFKNPGHRSSGP